MNKLDVLTEHFAGVDCTCDFARDTAALRMLKAVAEAADLAIDSGSVDEIHLSIIRDRLSALRAAGLMGGG